MTRALVFIFLGLWGAAISLACGPREPEVPTLERVDVPLAALQVGVARADITVPPGAATFGHALDAHVAEGYWTRTYCRVFYFRSNGKTLVLVPCELAAMSALLQRQVVANLKGQLHPSELMMTAVHTHAGVAHYFGSTQYTGAFSSRMPGYDHALMLDLAKQISNAIERARAALRPAVLSWRHDDGFVGFTRNRSIEAFRLNKTKPRVPGKRADLAAIDPEMHVLSIEAVDAQGDVLGPLGSLSFFAMHPTVLKNTNRLFGSDTAGVVSRLVERRLRQRWVAHPPADAAAVFSDPLHGVINTNEGDISPIWSRGDTDEAIAKGTAIGEYIWSVYPELGVGGRNPNPPIDFRYLEEEVDGLQFVDRGKLYELCDVAVLGMGTAGGGSDHPTSIAPIRLFGTDPPADYGRSGCQAPKVSLLWKVSEWLSGFPTVLPLSVARIDDTLISFVPAELTITAGARLNERVLEDTKRYEGAPTTSIVAGLANEYIQYVATREEYQLQAYEGASTIYGPDSAQYFRSRASLLAQAMFDPAVERKIPNLGKAGEIGFDFGPGVKRLAQPSGETVRRELIGACEISPRAEGDTSAPEICMYWADGGPGDVPIRDYFRDRGANWMGQEYPTWVHLVDESGQPLRACHQHEGACDPGGYVDDRGTEFRTRVHAEVRDRWIWSTRFSPSTTLWQELRTPGARIRVGHAGSVVSPHFSAATPLKPCEVEQARVCMDEERVTNWRNLIDECRADERPLRGRYRMWYRHPKGCLTD